MINLPVITSNTELKGKKVLLRVGFSVPVRDGKIENDFRIRKALPTINWLREQGAKIILVSHIWGDETTSLKIVHEYLEKMMEVKFSPDCVGENAIKIVEEMKDGDVVLLENTRLHDGEVGNQEKVAEALAKLADIYVNDAFSVSHRFHASIVGVPNFLPSYIGLQFKEEMDHLALSFSPPRPFLFVLGGAKFTTKIPLIRKFLEKADIVYVAGALVKPFLLEKGLTINQEHVPPNMGSVADIADDPKLRFPSDVVCFNGETSENIGLEKCEIEIGNIIDIGASSVEDLRELVSESAFVLWNGPLGDYQKDFSEGTIGFAKILIDSGVTSVVGGGDTMAVLENEGLDYEHGFTFTSTAGGAMLQFLADETLVGIDAIIRSNKNRV
ncbi:phosphoglycerate kinase [Candidatus Campbellbacteria bacterium CG22_combo_CG10-13_8_21_14_all_36_13]|uniref:Phosphoglycerate kinase n=1 Tax=Candidatus Campbellbacteria bacterium CG22_combo_CG10-13_8_21_14_all_36_13 TaxID=1974529 RepID=A0A2H0E0Q0_9BACT|nr:MAG: phosphoglycerate kinase [Candidatus Campbellbacteria bacterium CG22_combo_CG10-13_8_21_14_all_36_13]